MKTRSKTFNSHLKRQITSYLFHYTTPTGLIGILNSGEIWATNIRFLNDFNELIEAFDIAKSLLESKLSGSDSKSKASDLLSNMINKIDSRSGKFYAYVCSFSKEDDSLSQWRAYCPPTGGYALGISSTYLKQLLENENNWALGKCIYDDDIKKKIIDEVINNFLSTYKEKLKREQKDIGELNELLSVDFSIEIAKIGGFFKDEAFNRENEWRLLAPTILDDNPQIDFRVGISCIIPHYRFNLLPESTQLLNESIRIGIGPTPHMETQAKQAVQHLLITKWKIKGEIYCSKVPFKAW